MQDFKKLNVWEKAHASALAFYQITKVFPKDEIYGLTSQIRRASVSIPANIAEGCGRKSSAEFGQFLQISLGSTTELEYHLLLARDLKYLDIKDYEHLNSQVIEIRKMLISFIQTIKDEKGKMNGK